MVIDITLVNEVKLSQKALPKKKAKFTRFQVHFWAFFTIKLGKNEIFGQDVGGKSV